MYYFALTTGAVKELCERCPNHDIEQVSVLFDTEDLIERLDHMSWFICILSKWGTKKMTGSFEGALTMNDIDTMDINEIGDLFAEAMKIFGKDSKPSGDVESVKKATATPDKN